MIRTQRRFLNTLGVALILIICAVVALLLQRSRERAIDDLQRDTRNLTAALSLYTRGRSPPRARPARPPASR